MRKAMSNANVYALPQGAFVLLLALVAVTPARHAAAEIVHPTLHELDAIAAAAGSRLWYHEEEFARDPLLRAKPHQVVILHLEQGTKHGKSIRNTIPYLFPETAPYTFCVPKEDPHIRSLELVREGSHGVVVHVPRGAPCKTRTIAAGLYQLHVDHDGTDIPAEGVKAFIHVPRFKRPMLVGNEQSSRSTEALLAADAQSSFPSCGDGPFFDNDARLLFTAPNGSYVIADFDSGRIVASDQTPPSDYSGTWVICQDGSDNYNVIKPPLVSGAPDFFFSTGPPNTDTSFYSEGEDNTNGYEPTAFKLTDLGNGQFTLAANFGGMFYPIVVGADGALHWTTSGAPTTFTIVLKYYEPGVAAQPLLPGEVALFQACDYDVSNTGTWVFNTSISDFEPFHIVNTSFSLDNTVASVKLGPLTIATLYANANFSGTAQVMTADTPCLSSTPLGVGTASALKIQSARDFIASTKTCQNCNLSGVDLSYLDLSGGDFTGSIFIGANLTNTNFQSTTMDHANLSSYGGAVILTNTDFRDARLHCTNLQDSQLRDAFFWDDITPPILPIITRDFSCRLALQYASLNVGTFPVSDWRYLILNHAVIHDGSGQTLSTISDPLDLSRAKLSGAHPLTYVGLAGANLSGADFTGTNLTGADLQAVISVDPETKTNVPAVFTSATLTEANLQQANLVGARFQGAQLNSATLEDAILDGANLTDANLTDTSLKGVTLTNALLQGADLNFTNLDGANLCAAKLNESPTSSLSATLQGAFLRNVNLAQADLTGASLVNANFYSSIATTTCLPAANCGPTSCASAVDATLNNAVFTGAYLNGVDFSGSTPQSVDFANAALVGANFTNANLSQDINTGKRTNFTGAFLQGATFTNANVTGTNFTSAYVDLTSTHGDTLLFQLDPATHIAFPGYQQEAGSTLGCVEFTSLDQTSLPGTNSGNLCPDGNPGPCSTTQWQSSTPPPLPTSCTTSTVDFNWIFD
jgi:uncharacterized protein YjbI with pentapeptide repeats